MIIRSEFKVDLFQMKHARDPEGLLRTIKDVNAATLGRKLVELFPYERTDSYTGVLPEMSMNRDHEFNDTYGVELVVMDARVIRQRIHELECDAEDFVQQYNSTGDAKDCLAKAEALKQLLL